MGASTNSHGRKSDKETQSPMLKIFKEMMQRENDPEKANLLKEKHEDRKRRPYSGSRSKSEQRSIDSSSTERHHKRSTQYKVAMEQRNRDSSQCRTQSIPFHNSKKDSWWFWGEQEKNKEETCSCVSCALKKLASNSEYTCIGCLLLLFTVSIIVTFLLVFRTVPVIAANENLLELKRTAKTKDFLDSNNVKRKVDHNGRRSFGYDVVGLKGNKRDLNDAFSKKLMSGLDFGVSNYQESSDLQDGRFFSGISSVLDKDLTDDSSERLRNFYKKLVQTDLQIKKLKKGFNSIPSIDDSLKPAQDRYKRSLRLYPKSHFKVKKESSSEIPKVISPEEMDQASKFNIYYPPFIATKEKLDLNNKRSKRHDNNSEPIGFVIEKKKIIVEYEPSDAKRKIPKCSHTPKESSHENELKHPFYKNTQRLDELLDQFLDKNIPEVLSEQLGLDLFKTNKEKCKHPKLPDDVDETASNKMRKSIFGKKKKVQNEFKKIMEEGLMKEMSTHFEEDEKNRETATTVNYNFILSVATLMHPALKTTSPVSYPLDEKPPNLRKLMQIEEDDEGLGYEDFKEVLADDSENHDEMEKQADRKKRNDIKEMSEAFKIQPPGILNPNWKGPMPLYPDELTTLSKQPYMLDDVKIKVPVKTKDTPTEVDNFEADNNDIEYIENYLNNKYEKLVEMAQAYSDYGVLNDKKDSIRYEKTESPDKGMEHRVKLSISKKLLDSGIFGRHKKGLLATTSSSGEGIRFEFRPTSDTREDAENVRAIINNIHKHVKIKPNALPMPKLYSSTSFPMTPGLQILFSPDHLEESGKKINEVNDKNKDIILKIGKGKRWLMSIDDAKDSSEIERLAFNISNPVVTDIEVHNDTNADISLFRNLLVANESNTNMGPAEIFLLLSDWFSTIAGLSLNVGRENASSQVISVTETPVDKDLPISNVTEMMFPNYDADMIENIGHRSRVLLSVDDKQANGSDVEGKQIVDQNAIREKSSETTGESTEPKDNKQTITAVTVNNTNPVSTAKEGDKNTPISEIKGDSDAPKNKTVVKRSAQDDSNLIFWNDIYDDEYGVKIDPIENVIRDKHVAKQQNFMQKSSTWLQDKVKKFTDKLHTKENKENVKTTKKRSSRSINFDMGDNPKSNYYYNEEPNKATERPREAEEAKPDIKSHFAALSANMKKVCQQAAKAVRETKKIEVPADSKDSVVATSLMQQLVRLMRDLVDFQVQQKTCVKLPPDLRDFLEWLTLPNQNAHYEPGLHSIGVDEDIARKYDRPSDRILDIGTTSSSEGDFQTETRSQCLGTIQAVQDLIHQYEEMSDEDKSKMTGVKEYLENQLYFLNQQLMKIDEHNMLNTYQNDYPLRYRRENRRLNKRRYSPNRFRRRLKRKLHKFIKNFGKKHTKTTASYYEGIQVTDVNDGKLKTREAIVKNDGYNVNDGGVKRNLQDVYYKAVADSKKYGNKEFTTGKALHKKEDADRKEVK